jgi:predicted RNA-binding Zn-ribbon protein involved in translation (DUF1610 family)
MGIYSQDTSRLVICTKCFEVRGSVLVEGVAYQQLCSCRSLRAWENVKIAPRKDYATYAELCRACGLELIRSGSRWSEFFCPECHDAIRGLNRTLGFALIPIGRHSIMNSFSLSGRDIADQEKIDSFVKRLSSLSLGMDALHDWRRLMVARRCAELGFKGNKPIPLDDFLLKGKSVDRGGIKSASIRKLFAFFEVPDEFIRRDFAHTTNMN